MMDLDTVDADARELGERNACEARRVLAVWASRSPGASRIDADGWELADGREVLVTLADHVMVTDGTTDVIVWRPDVPTPSPVVWERARAMGVA